MRHMFVKSLTALIACNLLVLYQGNNSPTHQQIGEKAVLTIRKRRAESLNGYLLVVCKASDWKALEKDADLGPFLKYKKGAGNLDLIVAMPEDAKNGSTYGVYFQGNKPIGFAEIKTGQGEKISQDSLAKAYVSLTEDSDQGAAGQIRFEAGQVYSDDDKPIPTLKVLSDGPTPPDNKQEDFRSGAIKTATGFLVVWNQPKNYYILEIKGKDVRQTSTDRKVFNVDGLFLQIVDASIDNFLHVPGGQKAADKSILEAHRDWEAKFLESEYKAKLAIESSWQKLSSGKDALWWQATLPETAKTNVKKQVYLTIVNGDYVLMVGGAVTNATGEDAALQLLLNTIETLKRSDKPSDLQKLRDGARAETP